jgi:hypothetical protein
VTNIDTTTPTPLDAYIAHFRARVLQDALTEATAAYWHRRAATFEAARHHPETDHPGDATLNELRDQWARMTTIATACRNRATISLLQDGIDTEVTQAIRETT